LTYTTAPSCTPSGNRFNVVVEPFLRGPGLRFAEALSGQAIEQAFAERGGLFGQEDIFSRQVVLWAFLAQVLRDGKGTACASAVADIATCMRQTGGAVPSGDTGDYCRARAKLDLGALRRLVGQAAGQLDQKAPCDWPWHGPRAKLVDGFTFTMPDTAANQREFPQAKTQKPGVGLPLALLKLRGVEACTALHQCRPSDFRRGRRMGDHDHLVTWNRPERPEWMSEELHAHIPQAMTLRELKFDVLIPGCRTKTITVVTTLTDPVAYPKEDVAALFGCRWNAELDIRAIKQTPGLDHVRCKSPEMVRRELWVTLLAYNLIRGLTATAAAAHGKQPRQLGFTLACQTVLSSWMLSSTGACRDARGLWRLTLERIAANQVANRPGRIEPRVLKRRRHRYPLMTRPRQQLRKELCVT